MRHALERGEIMVLFRPIVRLEDRTVAGFQSLIRWRHPRLGVLGEDEFRSAAESTGASVDIGAYALEVDGAGARRVAEGARGQSADLRDGRAPLRARCSATISRSTCALRSAAITSSAAR